MLQPLEVNCRKPLYRHLQGHHTYFRTLAIYRVIRKALERIVLFVPFVVLALDSFTVIGTRI